MENLSANVNVNRVGILVLTVGIIFLVVNSAMGMLLSAYSLFNVCLTDVIVILTTVLIFISVRSRLKTAFRISLPFVFSLFGAAQFLAGIFAPARAEDNFVLIGIIIVLVVEVIIFLVTLYFTQPD